MCLVHTDLSAPCSLVTCWERAGLLAFICVMFSCVFLTFPYDVMDQVWCLIVSIPDICLLPYFQMFVITLLIVIFAKNTKQNIKSSDVEFQLLAYWTVKESVVYNFEGCGFQ